MLHRPLGGIEVARSWFEWLTGARKDGAERRAEVPSLHTAIRSQDIDPLTGALRWERFQSMLDFEQERAPGVLLVVDLSKHSNNIAMLAAERDGDIVPWLAQAIRQAIRADDLMAHIDGHRFAVLLRGAPQDVAQGVSERILESVDDTIFMTAEGITQIDVVIGGAVFAPASGRDPFGEATANLDRARNISPSVFLQ